jgi:hypothetical protein
MLRAAPCAVCIVLSCCQAIRPAIGLGLFWMEYCASSGTAVNARTPAVCRHDGRVQGVGCWGAVKGRLVYSNVFYHRRGNYPEEILYSCAAHAEEDEKDDAFQKCQNCEHIFRAPSMWTDIVCRTCFDRSNLLTKARLLTHTSPSRWPADKRAM